MSNARVIHELKIWPQYYSKVVEGTKTFEVRNNDRGFQKGDFVKLREFDPDPEGLYPSKGYTKSPELMFEIGYVLPIDENRVVFSLLKIKESGK